MPSYPSAPAGWYPPDPGNPNELRYWDGTAWTEAAHSQATTGPGEDFLPHVAVQAAPRDAAARRWFTTWPAIVLGYVLFVVPGVVALWFRRGPSVATKWVGTAIGALLLVVPLASEIGGDAQPPSFADGPAASPTPSAVEEAQRVRDFVTGAPEELSAGDSDRVEAMGQWAAEFAAYTFPEDYTETGGDAVDQLRALADSYPVETSPVVTSLRAASSAMAEGRASLGDARYDDAEADFADVEASVVPVYDQFLTDLANLEEKTGYRLAGDSALSDAVTEETAQVKYWIDGETVETTVGRVRLIGVNTPDASDQCFEAQDARGLVEALAPAGTVLTLVDPESVDDLDASGQSLRYVDLSDGTDIGYTLLLNDFARAQYDSQDGYQWHPREKAYRDTQARPAPSTQCTWAAAAALALVADSDDEDEHHRTERIEAVAVTLAAASVLTHQVADARAQDEAKAEAAAAKEEAAKEKAAKEKAAKKKSSSAPKSGSTEAEPWNRPGPDLDCADIGHPVQITGTDYHRLDRDGDGWGCESYG